MRALRVGVVDTGVNPWHSHVRGNVDGCRLFVDRNGRIDEDDDFRDPCGHGTAVAGVIREAFPDAHIFAVRVFDGLRTTYASLVARGLLRAAAEGCDYVNVSLGVPPGCRDDALPRACAAVVEAGCVVVAAARGDRPGWPAALPGVYAVVADDALAATDVRELGARRLAACGRPRDIAWLSTHANFHGASFACARALVHLASQRDPGTIGVSVTG